MGCNEIRPVLNCSVFSPLLLSDPLIRQHTAWPRCYSADNVREVESSRKRKEVLSGLVDEASFLFCCLTCSQNTLNKMRVNWVEIEAV